MKKMLPAALLTAVLTLGTSALWSADSTTMPDQPANPGGKAVEQANPSYPSESTKPIDDTKGVQTVPSGKRHRTHRKHHKTETTEDSKAIQSGDVTPSK